MTPRGFRSAPPTCAIPTARAPAARIVDPRDRRRIFSWLLERTEDALGNVITFEYVAEDLANVAASPCEQHRLEGTAPIANTYLKTISYGNEGAGDDVAIRIPDRVRLWRSRLRRTDAESAAGHLAGAARRVLDVSRRVRDPNLPPLPARPDVPRFPRAGRCSAARSIDRADVRRRRGARSSDRGHRARLRRRRRNRSRCLR